MVELKERASGYRSLNGIPNIEPLRIDKDWVATAETILRDAGVTVSGIIAADGNTNRAPQGQEQKQRRNRQVNP